jgi:hypothetical protein
MIKIFKTKVFGRWSEGEGLTDEDLCHAVDEINRGLVEASLGAKQLMGYDDKSLNDFVKKGALIKVECEDE